MYLRFSLEATQSDRIALELSYGTGYRHPDYTSGSPVQPCRGLDRDDQVSNKILNGRSHQRGRQHTITVRKGNLWGFKSLPGGSWKHLCSAKTMRFWKGSEQRKQGCARGRCCNGCTIQGGVGLPGYSATSCIARKTQDLTPDARQDAASGHCTNSHDLPSALCEFASGHGSSQHPPCARAEYPTRGVHSQALPTHSAILICQDVETYRRGFKFRNINTIFQSANGQPRPVLALQDTGADHNAIAEELVKKLGYFTEINLLTEDDKLHAPRGLGGETVCPSATIKLQFSTLCGRSSGPQIFNIYKQSEIGNHEVILDVTLVQDLGHLQQVPCENLRCSLV